MPGVRCLLVWLLLAPLAEAGDWPQWMGPRRDGSTAEKIAVWTEAPKAVWKQPVSEAYSSPVVADGRVFVHGRVAGEQKEEVVAFDAATGKELWRDAYPRSKYVAALGAGPRATPAIVGNRLFTFGITGVLSCYEAETGKRLWQVDLYRKLDAALPGFGVCCSPLVMGNRVFVSVGGKGKCLVALDSATGEIAWQALDEAASTSSPFAFAGESTRPAGLDVVFLTPLRLVGVSPLDGTINWEQPIVFQPSGMTATPIAAGDRIVASITGGTTAADVLPKGDGLAAKQAWQNNELTGYFSSGVAMGKDRAYLIVNKTNPLPSAALACVELKSGVELWRKPGIGYFHAAVIRTGDDKLLILDDSGMLKLVEDSAKEYVELAKAKVCGGNFVAPALADGRLFTRDDKELTCVQLGQ